MGEWVRCNGIISVHEGYASEYSGTDISARREKWRKKAYDSEEITTKAAEGRNVRVKRCYTCVVREKKVMTDERGAKSNRETERGHFYTTT